MKPRPSRYTCLCAACSSDFGSASAFDAHRTGSHDVVFRPSDPTTEGGRRCLAPDEMRAKGMHQDRLGRWRRGGDSPNPHVTGQPRERPLWGASRAAA